MSVYGGWGASPGSSRLARLPWRRRLGGLLLVLLLVLLLAVATVLLPPPAWADGEQLFLQHCAGCHVNGGNVIRRGRTLRLAALERQGLASQEAIAAIAASGVGQMSGYRSVLGDTGVQEVAAWVWTQAEAGWPR